LKKTNSAIPKRQLTKRAPRQSPGTELRDGVRRGVRKLFGSSSWNRTMKNIFRRKKNYKKYLWYIPLALVLMVGVYYLPPVQSRLAWRVDELYSRIKYFFNPPDQAVFQPEQTDNFESILATTRRNIC
jgi:hypothetical protein